MTASDRLGPSPTSYRRHRPHTTLLLLRLLLPDAVRRPVRVPVRREYSPDVHAGRHTRRTLLTAHTLQQRQNNRKHCDSSIRIPIMTQRLSLTSCPKSHPV